MKISPSYLAVKFQTKDKNGDENNMRVSFRRFIQTGDRAWMDNSSGLVSPTATNEEALAHFRRAGYPQYILEDTKFKHYLITETAQNISKKIRVTDDFDYSLLSTLRPQYSCYIISPHEFIRFYVDTEAGELFLLYVVGIAKRNDGIEVGMKTLSINFQTGIVGTEKDLSGLGGMKKISTRLLQLIIFVEMSEPEFLELPVGKKVGGSRTSGTAIFNDTGIPITRVDSSWNKFVTRKEDSTVTGHLRLARCGPQWSQRKLTWVREHTRKGYSRDAHGGASLS